VFDLRFCLQINRVISGLGFIVGSQVAQAAGSFRWGLRVTPVLGIIGFLLVIFLVQDPPRGLSEGSRLRATNWTEDFKYLCGKYVNSFNKNNENLLKLFFLAGLTSAWW
jgi:MFS transporter, Spinster family, sphingosine-1-phosphate transporter